MSLFMNSDSGRSASADCYCQLLASIHTSHNVIPASVFLVTTKMTFGANVFCGCSMI